jgi:hypothetical protein
MRRAVCVAFERDGRHGDNRGRGELLLEFCEFRLTIGESKPPAIIVDHDRDVIWIVEGSRATRESRVIEGPLRRSELPD